MPILSVFIGSTEITCLLFNSRTTFSFFHFPYIYSERLFASIPKEEYYKEVITHACKNFGTPIEKCEVISTSFLEEGIPGIETSHNVSLVNLLFGIQSFSYVFASGQTVIKPGAYTSAFPYLYKDYENEQSDMQVLADSEKVNFLANLNMYSHVLTTGYTEQFDFDDTLRYLSSCTPGNFEESKTVYFTGERFSEPERIKSLTYLLAIDLITKQGFFELKLDPSNKLPVVALLKDYKQSDSKFDLLNIRQLYFNSLGTLLNVKGPVECLFKTDAGTSQLIEVGQESLFIMPLEEGTHASVVVKGADMDSVEKSVSGGELGFIIDTRTKRDAQLLGGESRYQRYREWQKTVKEAVEHL